MTRWRRSGLTADEFAAAEGLNAKTLRWWSSRFGRGTRAKHGAMELVPIEIAVPGAASPAASSVVEIAVGDSVVRCDVGTDAAYVASLVRALRGS